MAFPCGDRALISNWFAIQQGTGRRPFPTRTVTGKACHNRQVRPGDCDSARRTAQNRILRPNWMMRGSPAIRFVWTILPKSAPERFEFGLSKFVWLKMLNISARNCTFTRSLIWVFLKKPMSKLHKWGP